MNQCISQKLEFDMGPNATLESSGGFLNIGLVDKGKVSRSQSLNRK
jgi:hypothetical protein